ncbi:MAG: hypothetical protein K9N47_12575 [Prosthecobacter sp.]|uniref:hypothetical protein n=1 Tax=Prosthecobacter sp. TaxID=1965333 RepID=UPI0025F2391D|nr:hypothetical protein [Prosthecobacter sp.]MCF7786952.1 hypothetical protein [Prosthecobacter sp.]
MRYETVTQRITSEYGRIYPGQDFSESLTRDSEIMEKDGQVKWMLNAKHAVVVGKADVVELERFVNADLPLCLQDFYAQIAECLLLLRYPVRIYSPLTLVNVENEIRAAEKIAGCPVPDSVTLLRLVEIPGFSASFGLRKFMSDGRWRMVHCGDETTAELQDSDDLWRPVDCEEFDDWIRRIIETDADPLVLDNPYMFRSPWVERIH